MIRMSSMKPRPELEKLLRAARKHKMTPREIWDQRISFVYGQLMDSAPRVTKEDIIARATEMYGPRPKR